MQQTHLLATRATPMLKSLQEVLKPSDLPLSEDQQVMRSVLGVKAFPDWVAQLSISDMMLIQPLATEDLRQKSSIRVEFSKDFMIYKAANVAVAYFCISTELLFLRGKQAYNPARDKPTEQYHMRALKVMEMYFPLECPLLQHIAQTYEKRFITDLQEIPEESQARSSRVRSAKSHSKRDHSGPKFPVLREQKSSRRTPSPTARPPKPRKPHSISSLPASANKSGSELQGRQYRRPGRRYRLSSGEEAAGSMDKLRERRNKSEEFLPDEPLEDRSFDLAYETNDDASPSPFIVS